MLRASFALLLVTSIAHAAPDDWAEGGSPAPVEGGMLAWNAQVRSVPNIYETEKEANVENLETAIFRTNGLPEVSAQWVHSNLGRFRLVDVREPREVTSGAVVQSEKIPLGDFMAAFADWPKDQAVVVHCASGGRSARAAMAMERAGFAKVASLEGGMIAWRGLGLPTA